MLAAGAALAALAMVSAAEAQTRVEVGVLTCSARGSQGFIIGSSRELRCQFKRQGRDEYYQGTIDKFGIDIGSTKQAKIGWAVLAPTSNLPPRSLNGTYAGVSAEATVGCGRRRQRPGRRLEALVRAAAAERAGAGRPQHRGRRAQLRLRARLESVQATSAARGTSAPRRAGSWRPRPHTCRPRPCRIFRAAGMSASLM